MPDPFLGKKQIKAWTERLQQAIKIADEIEIALRVSSIYVLQQKSGHGYTRDGFNSRWRNAKLLAAKTFPELDFDFTFHDLKAMGISDLVKLITILLTITIFEALLHH
ncbi:hypothetical protein [Yersinia enterocolitica]|uniref:hypothetical protein n=1 Tax=unclassified Yersinia (in: enterobacteria) TaxID=2653513 RepID=UPI00187D1DC2